MKILHIIFSMTIGGAETMLVDIVNEQCKTDDISIIVINNYYDKDLLRKISEKVHMFYINRKLKTHNIFDIIKLNMLVKNIKPEIINVHNETIVQLLFHNKIPICRTVHNMNNTHRISKKYDKLIAISESVHKDIKKKINEDSIVISNGICCNKIKSKENVQVGEIFKIVQVGRLDITQKGQDVLISAIKILVDNDIEKIHVDFIGTGESKNELVKLVNKLGIEKYITFLGLKDRNYIYNNLCNYDLFVQPSRYEGFGLTVAEAIVAEIPVLVSNIDGPMEIISNGKYGFYFKSEDINDCAEKIKGIINSVYKTNCKINREHVINNYDISKTVSEYKKMYGNMMENKI